MAIGNRDRYRTANEDMMRLLNYLRDLDLPGDGKRSQGNSANEEIMALWRHVFGDPEEWERKMAERNATLGFGESTEARLLREREEYVRKNLFR